MDFYTPLFSKVVDSSLWDEPDYVIKVFLTMIAKKDRDQVCRGTAYNIAKWSRKTEQEVVNALKILSEPDTKRLEPQPYDGRRVERVDDGWLILNGKYYQDLMGTVNRRAKKAMYEKNRRERKKKFGGSTLLPGEMATVAAESNGASVETTDAMTTGALPERLQ
jgi:hypothetical protein